MKVRHRNLFPRRQDNNETCANALVVKIYAKMSVFLCHHTLRNDIFAIFVT